MVGVKYNLFKHQEECIEYSKHHNKFILGDQMGLGKTFEAICTAITKKPEVRHCLVICCVNGMQLSWRKEIENATHEQVKVLGSRISKKTSKLSIKGNKQKLEDLNNIGDEYFLITNIEALRNADIITKLNQLCRQGQIGMCIIDEPHLGCLSKDTLILTTEGEIPIQDIVNSNRDFYVYARDCKGNIVPRKVLDKYKNGIREELIRLTIEDNGYIYTLECTPNHLINTRNRGYIPAEYINDNDDIILEEL